MLWEEHPLTALGQQGTNRRPTGDKQSASHPFLNQGIREKYFFFITVFLSSFSLFFSSSSFPPTPQLTLLFPLSSYFLSLFIIHLFFLPAIFSFYLLFVFFLAIFSFSFLYPFLFLCFYSIFSPLFFSPSAALFLLFNFIHSFPPFYLLPFIYFPPSALLLFPLSNPFLPGICVRTLATARPGS
jgi:hypothetical protein